MAAYDDVEVIARYEEAHRTLDGETKLTLIRRWGFRPDLLGRFADIDTTIPEGGFARKPKEAIRAEKTTALGRDRGVGEHLAAPDDPPLALGARDQGD